MTRAAAQDAAPPDGLRAGASLPRRDGLRYGAMGLPLAFVALPLYVLLPNFYARAFAVPLATLGALLLGARLFDAVVDPLLGRWSDRLYAQSLATVLRWGALAAAALGLGFFLLFFPPVSGQGALLAWIGASLVFTYLAYSTLSILHQAWGAMLGGDEVQRSRVVAWREAAGLVGVLVASVAPAAFGLGGTSVLLLACLALATWAWARGPRPRVQGPLVPGVAHASSAPPLWHPFTRPAFRRLFLVFVVNGISSAIPATLLLFFVQDRLQAPPSMEPVFLGSYFAAAALAIPLWLRLVRHIGLARTWLVGMLLAIATFVFAAQLGAGDSAAFVLVCVLCGVALGTDLALPGALLAGVIAQAEGPGRAEGSYFGWWNFATKLNLALAAGLALPLLGWLGYTPGAQDERALQTLTWAYCLLPCALKAAAAVLLYTLLLRKPVCNDATS